MAILILLTYNGRRRAEVQHSEFRSANLMTWALRAPGSSLSLVGGFKQELLRATGRWCRDIHDQVKM